MKHFPKNNHSNFTVSPQVLSPDCTNNLGSIVHGWDSMSSGYNLTVKFPDTEVNSDMKAVILGAAFLLVCNKQINYSLQFVNKFCLENYQCIINIQKHYSLVNIPFIPRILIMYQNRILFNPLEPSGYYMYHQP
jgi:hypothetical protein